MTEPIEAGIRGLMHQFREFLVALRLSPGRRSLALLVAATLFAVGATAAAQVRLNAWNGPFYEAIAQRNFSAFLYELLVFAAIAGGLLVLNVAQAWLREMIKLNSREWLTRDLVGEWLKPGRHARLAGAGEIGINPDQRIHEDARRLTELSADLGIGLLQALVLLLCFLGVLWTVAGEFHIAIFGVNLPIPGYMVWCAPRRASAAFSGSRRRACRYLSLLMSRRSAFVSAASSSSGRSITGTGAHSTAVTGLTVRRQGRR
jgi:vitamin B12/bleomycin/antimicrobial peptide transport system ATP-binding/permease protein